MFWLENLMQTLCMVGIAMSSYSMVYWWKKDKFGRASFNLLMFIFFFLIYDISEFIHVGG
ncbi:hypothetical protein [Bacillus phage vB_BanS-Thrax5]|nr:hypothetical protein [Bacillus phage vB_BanS-Thrax5]